MRTSNIHQNLFHTLRIAAAMCFIGHGAFGIITKPIWCNYMALFGIGPEPAYQLMPVVGTVDILLGFTLLVYPTRAVALWLVCWGIFTAALRPLSGESFAEMIERAGNYGAPLAMLLILGVETRLGAWFKKLDAEAINKAAVSNLVIWCLKVSSFLLLSGHGWLNLIHKPGLLRSTIALVLLTRQQPQQSLVAWKSWGLFRYSSNHLARCCCCFSSGKWSVKCFTRILGFGNGLNVEGATRVCWRFCWSKPWTLPHIYVSSPTQEQYGGGSGTFTKTVLTTT